MTWSGSQRTTSEWMRYGTPRCIRIPKRLPSSSTSGPSSVPRTVWSPLIAWWLAGRRSRSNSTAGGAAATAVAVTVSRSTTTVTSSLDVTVSEHHGRAPARQGGGSTDRSAGPAGNVLEVPGLDVEHAAGDRLEGCQVRRRHEPIDVLAQGRGVVVEGEELQVGAGALAQLGIRHPGQAALR